MEPPGTRQTTIFPLSMGADASTGHLSVDQRRELVAEVEKTYKGKADSGRLADLDKLKTEFIRAPVDGTASAPLNDLLGDVAAKVPDELSAALANLAVSATGAAPSGAPSAALRTRQSASFRERRLSMTKSRASRDDVPANSDGDKAFCQAREFGTTPSKEPPFPSHIVGTFSCHGIEPAAKATDGAVSKINQDRGSFVHPFAGDATQALFCVFDGHGACGDVVSHVVMVEMQQRLAAALKKRDDPPAALKKVFVEIDEALPELVGPTACQNSGTTAVVVLLRGSHCWVAHAGDSRAVVGTAPSEPSSSSPFSRLAARDLSADHKPDDPKEKARIIASGGYVKPAPRADLSARVYTDAAMTRVGLAMARSIGDKCVKGCGVIADPTVSEFDLSEDDRFILLASDGVCVRAPSFGGGRSSFGCRQVIRSSGRSVAPSVVVALARAGSRRRATDRTAHLLSS